MEVETVEHRNEHSEDVANLLLGAQINRFLDCCSEQMIIKFNPNVRAHFQNYFAGKWGGWKKGKRIIENGGDIKRY